MTRRAGVVIVAMLWPVLALGQPVSPAPSDPGAGEHSGHGQAKPAQSPTPPVDHSMHKPPVASAPLPAFIPALTDADRKAAFPDVQGHSVHDDAVNYFVLFDQLEWLGGDGDAAANWDSKGWIGRDRDRLWFRSEGERNETGVEHAEVQVFYGRAVARWWDLVVGVRQDVRPGPARTWAAVGVQGLAPYWFEIEATAYVGEAGRTHVRFETEYDLLLTNRLILQPLVEIDVYGKNDPERGIGSGLSSTDAGFRLRYEFRRELAPYVGVTWGRKYFGTADAARAAGEKTAGARFAVGVRLWI